MDEIQDAFRKFSESTRRVLIEAQRAAEHMGSSVNSEHILLALATIPGTYAFEFLRDARIDIDQIKLILSLRGPEGRTSQGLSVYTREIITRSVAAAAVHGHAKVEPEHLLYAITSLPESLAYQIIQRIGVNPANLRTEVEQLFEDLEHFQPAIGPFEPGEIETQRVLILAQKNRPKPKAKLPALESFAVDLTEMARQNLLDPLIGRENELARTMQILSRRLKNNPVLVGDPGVGKTAIVEGLAQLIIGSQVPNQLKDKQIWRLDLALLVAGTMYRGQFEERLKKVISEVKKNHQIILFIDELHTMVGAGSAEGSLDVSNILKPALAKGEIRLIGATTLNEFRKYIEKDAALDRRLQKIIIEEPSEEATIAILEGLKPRYEAFHSVSISRQAIVTAVKLAKRYIPDRFLPDKAIDLIDEAAAALQLTATLKPNPHYEALKAKVEEIINQKNAAIKQNAFDLAAQLRQQELVLIDELKKEAAATRPTLGTVDRLLIEKICAATTGVPVGQLTTREMADFRLVEQKLASRIFGQTEAIKLIAGTIKKAKAGLTSPNRPLGSFLLLGPTGVGKTYTAQILAETVFGSSKALIRVDMSEFMERHAVARLVGAPPGYVGYEEAGQLTEAIRRQPYSVVLLDEIEKAHPEVSHLLLQILEDGQLTDAKGLKVSFRNAIIIMTSNIGTEELTKIATIGFKTNQTTPNQAAIDNYEKTKSRLLKELKFHFRPEFLNRIDHTVVYQPLSRKAVMAIINQLLRAIEERLRAEQVKLKIDQSAKKLLYRVGYDPLLGAREIRRAIAQHLEDPIADKILARQVRPGSIITITTSHDRLTISTQSSTEKQPKTALGRSVRRLIPTPARR